MLSQMHPNLQKSKLQFSEIDFEKTIIKITLQTPHFVYIHH